MPTVKISLADRKKEIKPQIKPDHTDVFHQQMISGYLRHFTAGKANRHDAAFRRHAAQGLHKHFTANRIVDFVSAATAGYLQHCVAKIFLAIIDCVISTMSCSDFELFFGASCRNNGRT